MNPKYLLVFLPMLISSVAHSEEVDISNHGRSMYIVKHSPADVHLFDNEKACLAEGVVKVNILGDTAKDEDGSLFHKIKILEGPCTGVSGWVSNGYTPHDHNP